VEWKKKITFIRKIHIHMSSDSASVIEKGPIILCYKRSFIFYMNTKEKLSFFCATIFSSYVVELFLSFLYFILIILNFSYIFLCCAKILTNLCIGHNIRRFDPSLDFFSIQILIQMTYAISFKSFRFFLKNKSGQKRFLLSKSR
jgi:hypothetical protein